MCSSDLAIKSKSEEHAIAMQNYATALASADRLDDSLVAGGKAIAIFETLKNYDAGGLTIAYDRRAQTLQKLGRHDLVNAQYEKALTLSRKSYGEGGALYLNTLLSKAMWLHGQGQRAEAWALVEQVVATPRQPSSDSLGIHEQHYVRGVLLMNEGKFSEAVVDLSRAVDGWRAAANHPQRLRAAEEALAKAQAGATS